MKCCWWDEAKDEVHRCSVSLYISRSRVSNEILNIGTERVAIICRGGLNPRKIAKRAQIIPLTEILLDKSNILHIISSNQYVIHIKQKQSAAMLRGMD